MLSNLVLETCNAPGNAASIVLAGAPTGRVPFVRAFASGASCFYIMDDGVQQEAGIGTFTAGAPSAFTRTTVLWTSAAEHSSPSRLNFTGATRIYNALPAECALYTDLHGNVVINGTAAVNGNATFEAGVVIVGATAVNGNATFEADVVVSGSAAVNGAATFEADAAVVGAFTVNGRTGIGSPPQSSAKLLVAGSGTELSTVSVFSLTGGYYPAVGLFGTTYGGNTRIEQTAGKYEYCDEAMSQVRFSITRDGACYNLTGTYGTLSDETLKENIAPARSYLADLRQINVVNYSLKKDNLPAANMLGVLAQQVESLIPGLVEDAPGDPATPGGAGAATKYVKSSVLIFMLLQALQELAAKVDALAPPHAPAT